MPWYLDQIGGQPVRHATFRFGDGQNFRPTPSSSMVFTDQSRWPIIIEQANSIENKLDFTIGPLTSVLLVKDSFKTLVEEFEPGLHNFFPVEMHLKDGKIIRDQFYIFESGQIIENSIVIEESDIVESVRKGVVRRYGPTSQHPRILWKESAVSGKHIWIEKLLTRHLTVSDAFYEEAKARKLSGWLAIEGRIKAGT